MTKIIFPTLSRRSFLISGLVAGASFGVPTLLKASALQEKKLYLYNMHTGEWFKNIYWQEGSYVNESLKQLNHFMRDRRTGAMCDIEPALFDLMEKIGKKVDKTHPIELVCGFRSAQTNKMLRNRSKGVAKNSLHMSGCAADIRIKGTSLKHLRDAAKSFKKGGVGYYPRSNFVHVDIRDRPYFW